ncbi:MAG: glycosyltransferase [Nitrospinaceae bacterium]
MSRCDLIFCTAPEKAVQCAIGEVLTPGQERRRWYFGPAHSPAAALDQDHFLSWGGGPLTWRTALRWAGRLKALHPRRVVLPLNNADGGGYRLLRTLARWLSRDAWEVPLNGQPRRITWSSLGDLRDAERHWHAAWLLLFQFCYPLFLIFLKRAVPDPKAAPRPRMDLETVQDHDAALHPEVSVIIRAFNEERYLARTLEMILRQKGPSREVILIDSESTDRTVEIAQKYPIRIYRIAKASFHYSAALNLGARLARGRFLVHLSAHSVPAADAWLRHLIAPLREDPEVCGVCGRELPIAGWASPFERKLLDDMFGDRRVERTDSFFFSNANAAVRREQVLETPFDEAVDWGEDQVWADAMLRRGGKTVYQPESAVYHSHNLTMAQCFTRTLRFQRMLLQRMHRGREDSCRNSFRSQLPVRAMDFRRHLARRRLVPGLWAWFYAPFCEHVNFLGCEVAWREWKTGKLTASTRDSTPALEPREVQAS